MKNNRSFGKLGEAYAADYLKSNGYEIIGMNVYVSHEEIDIIARNEEYLLFVEVKTRRQIPGKPDKYGRPSTAVDYRKKNHLLSSVSEYVREHPEIKGDRKVNIDVIEVFSSPTSDSFSPVAVNHIRNAVTAW